MRVFKEVLIITLFLWVVSPNSSYANDVFCLDRCYWNWVSCTNSCGGNNPHLCISNCNYTNKKCQAKCSPNPFPAKFQCEDDVIVSLNAQFNGGSGIWEMRVKANGTTATGAPTRWTKENRDYYQLTVSSSQYVLSLKKGTSTEAQMNDKACKKIKFLESLFDSNSEECKSYCSGKTWYYCYPIPEAGIDCVCAPHGEC